MTSNTSEVNGDGTQRTVRVRLTQTNTMCIDFRGLPDEPFQTSVEIAGFHAPPHAVAHSGGENEEGIIPRVERMLQAAYPLISPDFRNETGTQTTEGAAPSAVHELGPFRIQSPNPILAEPVPDNLQETPATLRPEGGHHVPLDQHIDRPNMEDFLRERSIRFALTLGIHFPELDPDTTHQAVNAFRTHLEGALNRSRRN